MKRLVGMSVVVLALAGCGGAGNAATPTPSPVNTDAVFLTQYRERFPGGTDEAGVRIGRGICDAYKAGTSFAGEVAFIRAQNPAITGANAGYLIGASTAAYCPEFNDRH